MGLDMYLEKKTWIGNHYKKPEEQVEIKIDGVIQNRVSTISEQVGYWRKANAIHSWMVSNLQNGNDDCGYYYFPREKMQELLNLVKNVLKDRKNAEKLLPTQSGFFFGNTDYDENYLTDLKETKRILEQALKEDGECYYHSSW